MISGSFQPALPQPAFISIVLFPKLTTFPGSFRNPPPGQPRSELPSNPDLRLGQKVINLQDSVARENFRVVLILPEEVEQLDLSDLDDVRRQKWTLLMDEEDEDGPDGKWVETEIWP